MIVLSFETVDGKKDASAVKETSVDFIISFLLEEDQCHFNKEVLNKGEKRSRCTWSFCCSFRSEDFW